jgi:predicted DCC family thiol-disulfide oxidoreductase YuxK
MIDSLPKDKKIILFDGVCNLCNSSVNKVISHDKNDIFRFASLQSDVGIAIQKHLQIDSEQLDSIILYESGKAYYHKSTAALKIMNEFGGFWKLMEVFYILPEALRNVVYNFIAKNRYKWFGKQDSCTIPTPELKAKFLG